MKSFFLALLCSGCTLFAHTQVLNTGMYNGGVFTNITTVGTASWSNTSNVQTSNSSSASASVALAALGSASTRYITVANFGMSVPMDAVIDGIQVQIKRRAQGIGVGSSIKDNLVQIIKGGNIIGANKASATSWPTTYDYATYGADTAAWGTSWSAADINSANFGVAISARFNAGVVGISLTAQIDHVQLIVYYHMPPVALPVEITAFNAQVTADEHVQLNWATALEINNHFFTVERSGNGIDWDSIADVEGMGTSTVLNSYSYTDQNPLNGAAYYRLKQYDYDGAYEYSFITTAFVNVQPQSDLRMAYLPGSGQLVVKGEWTGEPQQISVYDMSGRVVDVYTAMVNEVMQLRQHAAAGTYIVKASTTSKTVSQKIYR